MKWILPVIACAALVAFAGCKPSETQSGAVPGTNAPAAQAAAAAQPVPETAPAPAPAPAPAAPAQN